MKYLNNFKLFESISDKEIELFEDMLQEYFDEFKIYPKKEAYDDSTKFIEVLGSYEINRASSTMFRLPGFKNKAKGIHIVIRFWGDDRLHDKLGTGLSNFIRRIQKMGYDVEYELDDRFGLEYHISIIEEQATIKESIEYLNSGFEVSEDDHDIWSEDHDLDKSGFSKRERDQIDFWSRQYDFIKKYWEFGGKIVDEGEPYSYVRLSDGDLSIDIARYEDEWFTLFLEDDGMESLGVSEEYYIFDNWEDLDSRVTKILDNYLNNNSDEDEEYEDEDLFTISHKVNESLNESEESVDKWRPLLESVSDVLVTEMSSWDFIECDSVLDDTQWNVGIDLPTEIRKHPEKDFVFRLRLCSWESTSGDKEYSICVDVVYNTNLCENSYGKNAPKLIHDFFKFSKRCARQFGLIVRPFSKDMSNYDNFTARITHFHASGELRFYMGFNKAKYNHANESNMPKKFETDEDKMAIIKWVEFKENYPRIEFTEAQRRQIESALDVTKFAHKWSVGQDNGPEFIEIVYNKWTKHDIPKLKNGYNKYYISITARVDEWFLISIINVNFGYSSNYLADQFDQVLEFIKSLDPDTNIDSNPFGFFDN